jgi:hypothetical protein
MELVLNGYKRYFTEMIKALSSFLTAAVLLTIAGTANAQILNPITFSFSGTSIGDAVVAAPGDTTTIAVGSSSDSGFHYFAQGGDGNASYGLPTSGTFLSESNTVTKIATFQFQPYTSTNVLNFDGSLNLSTPASYSNLALLVNSTNSTAATFTLNFTTGPSTVLTTAGSVPFFVTSDAVSSAGFTVALTSFALDNGGSEYSQPVRFYEYDLTLSPTDSARTLTSIGIGANGGNLVTYAVSGTLEVPEPSTYAMIGLGLVSLFVFGKFRKLTA